MKPTICHRVTLILFFIQFICCSPLKAQELQRQNTFPLGIAWGFDYGHNSEPPLFMDKIRELGIHSTKVYLFWNQIEPEKGKYEWGIVDALMEQLAEGDEVLLAIYSASTWATSISTNLLPPSPAKSEKDYYDFIYQLVKRTKGKVKYWQNDCEPNNPVYWAGNKQEFIDQTKVFYKAVKDADPKALVVLGGYDGLFNPPGMPEMPNQKAGLSFFEDVIQEARGFFDVFDLRLYANPYTIRERVAYFRNKLDDIPIICSEYNGPGFMEFPVNRQYGSLLAQWSAAYASQDTAAYYQVQEKIKAFYERKDELAPETRLFLEESDSDYGKLYEKFQAADLVIRNILALEAGVQKTFFWDFWHDTENKYDLMTIMYGKNKMADYENGEFKNYRSLAGVMKGFAHKMEGFQHISQIEISENEDILSFLVEKISGDKIIIIWEKRTDNLSKKLIPEMRTVTLPFKKLHIQDIYGEPVNFEKNEHTFTFPVSSSPVFVISH
ncbi:beta-galactosidase [Negadavirga shengliensis]|uniref:Beta-galactosidase n=1 Tax=Negadavirga shengliensis TaxID=1389218 RepID=A0ABV9T5Z2_9BACT